jgi:hypothetical protein
LGSYSFVYLDANLPFLKVFASRVVLEGEEGYLFIVSIWRPAQIEKNFRKNFHGIRFKHMFLPKTAQECGLKAIQITG